MISKIVTTMDQRQSRFLAVSLLIIAVLLSYLVTVQPWIGFRAAQSEAVEDLRFQLARYQRLAGRQQELEALLKSAKRHNGGAGYYLAQTKPALASAELEQYLEKLLGNGNAQIVSTQAVSNAGNESGASVAVKVRMRSDLMTLVSLLHRIETGSPTLFIDNLVITRRGGRQRNDPAQQQLLDVQFDMVGFLRGQS
jgi:general secretion pathway protein M